MLLMLLIRPAIASTTSNTTRTAPFLRLFLLALLLGSGAGSIHAADDAAGGHAMMDRKAAERSLMQGWIDEAVVTSQRIVSANPKDGQAYLLLCRSFYAEERLDEAIAACENAVQALPRSSDAQDWLGRAYGMKADSAGPIAAFNLARKVKAAFETAVALDPGNGAAVNDLSEFYIEAPSVIGGGQDKAAALANHVAARLPQEAHRIRARAAEKRKDYSTAEREYKAAVEVANHPDAWVDLGAFYRRRAQYDKAVDALRQCLAVDQARDASIVDAASLLDRMHREPQLAEQALRQYLGSDAKNDAAPAIKVHVMLGKLLAGTGDKAGAKIEFDKSLELASNYAPAKQALQEL
jgi:tetratricopeptide (TPR) repeat protein